MGTQLLLRSKTRYYSRGSIIADSREIAKGLIVITSGQVLKFASSLIHNLIISCTSMIRQKKIIIYGNELCALVITRNRWSMFEIHNYPCHAHTPCCRFRSQTLTQSPTVVVTKPRGTCKTKILWSQHCGPTVHCLHKYVPNNSVLVCCCARLGRSSP